jgi:hypothetical protein
MTFPEFDGHSRTPAANNLFVIRNDATKLAPTELEFLTLSQSGYSSLAYVFVQTSKLPSPIYAQGSPVRMRTT